MNVESNVTPSATPAAAPANASPPQDVEAGRTGRAGVITLNRTKALNALTLPMVQQIQSALDAHLADPAVEVIVIRSSSPKAFCAGGDMRHIRDLSLAGEFDAIAAFFTEEYALNLAIAECAKPFVALIDGIAMGGGLGLSVHGKHCVVTARSMLAMPETAIGFIPDVGASYFLSQIDPAVGMWLALTGARVDGTQAVAAGLATQLVAPENLPALLTELGDASAGSIDDVLRRAAVAVPAGALDALKQRAAGFDAPKLADVMSGWRAGPENGALPALSPAAIAQTFQLLHDARGKSLKDCLALEFEGSMHCAHHPDFIEGVRAVLVDKDRNPIWSQAPA